jgi:hypothetical protein
MFCCFCPVVFAALPGFSLRFKDTPVAYLMQQLFLFFSALDSSRASDC